MTLAGRIRGKDVKTDNRSLPTKLAMRTRVLQAAGVTEARVLDVCAGEGRIWDAMRRRIAVAQYVPCDKTSRRPGAFELEAIQAIRVFDLAEFNVIDIDPYGDPWWIYFTLLPLLRTKTCVFLTWGTTMPKMEPDASRVDGYSTRLECARRCEGAGLCGAVFPCKST